MIAELERSSNFQAFHRHSSMPAILVRFRLPSQAHFRITVVYIYIKETLWSDDAIREDSYF